MKKGRMALFALGAIAAGILTGVLLSRFLFGEEARPLLTEVFSRRDDEQDGEGTNRRRKATQAGYKITKGQKYYTQLVDKSAKNILLVGEDATSGNYDTIIVVSVSEKNKNVQIINFPRDLYIDYSEDVLKRLKEKSPALYGARGFQKLNAAHNVGARIEYEEGTGMFGNSRFDFLADIMEEVFSIPIENYIYANLKGFREVVDLFGGVEINVPIRMKYDDPVQNLHIDLKPGLQHLNGEKAEWFVRFRQGYDDKGNYKSYSDQFRKQNQNDFLKAFLEQHMNLKSLGKAEELSKLINEHMRTSITGAKPIASYASLTRKAITASYSRHFTIIECAEPRRINGVYFDILKSQ